MKMITEMMTEDVEINFSREYLSGHYTMTPYTFNPKIGHKLVANDYVDLGQGILDCLTEMHEILNSDLEMHGNQTFTEPAPGNHE